MIGYFILLAAAAPAATNTAGCTLSTEDKAANAKLSFEDFDQKGVTEATSRKLGERGCWKEAAEATEHYLIHGPFGSEAQQRVMRFHLAQALANSGDKARAAVVVAGTRNPLETLAGPTDLRWNDFVAGHWAFFTGDRPLLEASVAEMRKGAGFGNRLNTALLEGLAKCFGQSYLEACSEPCRTPPPEPQ